MAASALEGIFPALHTAFDSADEIDWAAQRLYTRRLVAQGVTGFFSCGTSAEFPFLSLDERKKLTELAIEEAAGKASVLVHVGGPRTRDAIELARHAEKSGAAAVSSVPPYYYAYREDAVLEHSRAIASSVGLPFLYYHIPERTGFTIDERFLERLLSIPSLGGMKYSMSDPVLQERLQSVAGPSFKIFCGCDEALLPSLLMGAVGAIGSTYNFLAPLFLPLWRAFREGRLADANTLQHRANRIITQLAPFPGIASSKVVMRFLGVDLGEPRRPQSRLSESEKAALESALRASGLLEAAR